MAILYLQVIFWRRTCHMFVKSEMFSNSIASPAFLWHSPGQPDLYVQDTDTELQMPENRWLVSGFPFFKIGLGNTVLCVMAILYLVILGVGEIPWAIDSDYIV